MLALTRRHRRHLSSYLFDALNAAYELLLRSYDQYLHVRRTSFVGSWHIGKKSR